MTEPGRKKPPRPGGARWRWAAAWGGLIVLVLLPFVIFGDQLETALADLVVSAQSGAVAAGLIGGILAIDVVAPVPSSLVTTAAGGILGIALGTVVCWLGMMAGCLVGYWIGKAGGLPLLRWWVGPDEVAQARARAGTVGLASVAVARPVPMLAEASVIAAGAAGVPFWPFVFVCAASNLAIAAIYVVYGALALERGLFLLAFAGAIALPALGMLIHRLWRSGR